MKANDSTSDLIFRRDLLHQLPIVLISCVLKKLFTCASPFVVLGLRRYGSNSPRRGKTWKDVERTAIYQLRSGSYCYGAFLHSLQRFYGRTWRTWLWQYFGLFRNDEQASYEVSEGHVEFTWTESQY
ncbi:uncharacterized protein LOC105704022 [Orussus abietinus]|uniref:uncharacterized protein LOC105704022 n=1 Tax=Orussus abietinus TaxID=222816 RepID=UPI000626650F|nr:uncharacterized protein LOC105704022 [Orussus abietinus]